MENRKISIYQFEQNEFLDLLKTKGKIISCKFKAKTNKVTIQIEQEKFKQSPVFLVKEESK